LRILLDHNLDRRLKRYLTNCEVATTQEQGWSDATNGRLLALAESNGFNILLTADAHIKEQQNLSGRSIAVLVLRAPDNRLGTHVSLIPDIENALSTIQPGQIVEIYYQS
jgi:predicted nuclease of predicted toxin-antitoxin system